MADEAATLSARRRKLRFTHGRSEWPLACAAMSRTTAPFLTMANSTSCTCHASVGEQLRHLRCGFLRDLPEAFHHVGDVRVCLRQVAGETADEVEACACNPVVDPLSGRPGFDILKSGGPHPQP